MMVCHSRVSPASSSASRRHGVTIIECVVAIVIVSGAILSAAASMRMGIEAQEEALRLSLASSAAESALTELLVHDYDGLAAGVTEEALGSMSDPFTGSALPADYSQLGRRRTVVDEALAIPGYAGLSLEGKMLTVTVFDHPDGAERALVTIQRFRPKTVEEAIDG